MLSSLRLGDRNSDNYDDEDMSYEGSADTYGDFALAPLFDTFKVRYILAKLDHPRLGKSFFKISYSSYRKESLILMVFGMCRMFHPHCVVLNLI